MQNVGMQSHLEPAAWLKAASCSVRPACQAVGLSQRGWPRQAVAASTFFANHETAAAAFVTSLECVSTIWPASPLQRFS